MSDMFGYDGKLCVVVTGAASGMGHATTELLVELGAPVYARDINPVDVPGIAAYIPVDLSSKDSIDSAFAQLPAAIDRYFGVAGLRGATLPFMTVALINLVANGMGVSLLMRKPASHLADGRVALVDIESPVVTYVKLYRLRGHRLSPEARKFFDYVAQRR